MISLQLTKQQKKAEAPTLAAENRPEYPWGTRLTFESEQVKKIPALKTANAGDMVSGTFEAKIVEVRITDRDKDKERHTVEVQIQKIDIGKISVKGMRGLKTH